MKEIFENGRVRAHCPGCEGALSTFFYKGEREEFGSIQLVKSAS